MSSAPLSVSTLPLFFSALSSLPLIVMVIGLIVIVAVANRSEPDPSGHRARVVYYFTAAFFFLWAAFVGATVVVTGFVQLIDNRSPAIPTNEIHPLGDAVARQVVIGVLILIVSGFAFVWHHRRGLAIASNESTLRVARSYAATISFSAVVIIVVSAVVGIYSLCSVVAPGVFDSAGRAGPGRIAIVAGYLAVSALWIRGAYGSLRSPIELDAGVAEIER